MAHRHTLIIIAFGLTLTLFGVFADEKVTLDDFRAVGVAVLLAGLGTLAVRGVNRPQQAVYELGRADGYREGYHDGRRVARPVVVKIPLVSPEYVASRGTSPAIPGERRAGRIAEEGGRIDSPEWRDGAVSPARSAPMPPPATTR